MADIAYEVSNGVYKVQNGAIQQAFAIAGITVTSVLNGDSATMTLNEDIDDDGVAEHTSEFTLSGGEETFELAPFEVKQDNEIWVEFDFEDDGNIADAGRIEDVTFEPEEFVLGLTEIQNYIEDDWDDNRLTDRQWRDSDINQGVFAHPDANEAGDTLIGRYRPEWVNTSSDITATNQQIEITTEGLGSFQGDFHTVSSLTSGSWQFDYSFVGGVDAPHGPALVILGDGDGTPNSGSNYHTHINGRQELFFRKIESGTATLLISASYAVDSAEHTLEKTRDSYGDFEVIRDGVSAGTATDTFLPEKRDELSFWWWDGGVDTITIDNLVIN